MKKPKLLPSPPALFFFSILTMEGVVILLPDARFLPPPLTLLGLPMIVGGIWLHMTATRLFRRKGTTLATLDSPRALVTEGPFRLTRNPMYLAGGVILLGLSLFLGGGPSLLVPLLFALLVQRWYIRPEEALLRREFGEEYAVYSARVRAWI